MREIRSVVRDARVDAQGAFGAGVEAMISEMRRFAAAAEKAIGEISIDEAFHGIARVVNERVEQLTGKPVAALAAPQPADLRAAWEAGFRLCRSYGDNHAHFDGEQKERQWHAYMLRIGAVAAPQAHAEQPEQCICAAIKLPNGEVWRGHRHDNCIRVAGRAGAPRDDIANAEQGFITSSNRFVGREEGAQLQRAAGIPSAQTGQLVNDMLFSEDLYLRDWRPAVSPAPVRAVCACVAGESMVTKCGGDCWHFSGTRRCLECDTLPEWVITESTSAPSVPPTPETCGRCGSADRATRNIDPIHGSDGTLCPSPWHAPTPETP